MSYEKGANLEAFNEELAAGHMRGQWISDDRRDAGVGGAWKGDVWEPAQRGKPHLWKWANTKRFLDQACDAVPQSFTARRSLIFINPGLERSITHTLNVGVHVIKPGELAWAHRHTISALRFVIDGNPNLHTVVDGVPCPMETGDLVLTPNWQWHDHHNGADERVYWVDVLDGPLVNALNQTIFENYGEDRQPVRNDLSPARLRYPWAETRSALDSMGERELSPHDGHAMVYADPETGGAPMKTIEPAVQRLPAGFAGAAHRHSASTVYFVMAGTGRTEADGVTLEWGPRDCFVIPAWAPHAHTNLAADEDALLFRVSDRPALEALGLYREETIQ